VSPEATGTGRPPATLAATPSFRVEVPATSANLGPGFDALGMALGLTNMVHVQPSSRAEVHVAGEGVGELSSGTDNLVYQALMRVSERIGAAPPSVRLHCQNAIPLARGLGSSSAAIVAGSLIGNRLHGDRLRTQQLLELAIEIEGHG